MLLAGAVEVEVFRTSFYVLSIATLFKHGNGQELLSSHAWLLKAVSPIIHTTHAMPDELVSP